MTLKIQAFQIAEKFNIKDIKRDFAGKLIGGVTFDLFYEIKEKSSYLLVLDYGVAVFAGFDQVDISKTLAFLRGYAENTFDEMLTEDFEVTNGSQASAFSFNSVNIPDITPKALHLVMFNVGQSVGLDYYSKLTQSLLDATTEKNDVLERKGKFQISKKELLKFIGKSLNTKMRIIDNIYVLDEPDFTWEDESLNKLHQGLRDIFDIRTRFREIDYQLQIVMDNLNILTELVQHRASNRLEWIIIFLILFEVLNVLINQIF
jgi:uncharacterized Rmd1/YagE family protein